MIFDNVAELKRYWSKHIFSLPAIVKNQLSMIVDPVLFMQLYFVGQDKKDTSNIAHHGFYNKQDYIEMLYAYAGLGGEQLSQERIDEIKHRISELSDEKKVLLKVTDLKQWFPLKKTKLFQKEQEYVRANDGITLNIYEGETVGLVGESGCGKSVTSQCLMRLNPEPPGFFEGGEILYKGKDVLKMNKKELRQFRGKEISYIFQDPMTSLNPTMRIGKQIEEVFVGRKGMSAAEKKAKALEILKMVGISDGERRYKQYPHELSGGMKQRVMIAIALVGSPSIVIADEPTTSLDVTIEAQILDVLKNLQKTLGTSIILITHDLGVIAKLCDRVLVMYGGKIVERGSVDEIFYDTAHPYTKGLMHSIAKLDTAKGHKLQPIEGTPPDLFAPPKGCPFAARCEYCMEICKDMPPQTYELSKEHETCCWLQHEYAPDTDMRRKVTEKGEV